MFGFANKENGAFVARLFNKKHRKSVDSDALAETGIVFSNLSAAQQNNEGFVLVGTLHFNVGEIEFDEGWAEFALRRARLSANGHGCGMVYTSIAYVGRSTDVQEIHHKESATQESESGKSAALKATAGASLTRGLAAKAEFDGAASLGSSEHKTIVSESSAVAMRSLITASPRGRKGHLAEQVDWLIYPDPLLGHETENGNQAMIVIGERMRSSNDQGGLALVHFEEPDGYLQLELTVRAADIVWTKIDFPESSPLHQHGHRLQSGTSKRDIVGRLALAKALEGKIFLHRAPEEQEIHE